MDGTCPIHGWLSLLEIEEGVCFECEIEEAEAAMDEGEPIPLGDLLVELESVH